MGGGRDCVVDGDTCWFAGEKYRIADIDTPETHPPRCAEEARLGAAATGRLRDWLNAGAFSLEAIDRNSDRYGRKLRVVTRGGERSEEHTSELQSLMRISYAVFCLHKKKKIKHNRTKTQIETKHQRLI